MKKYEGMFLVDQEVANKKWDETIGHLRSVLEKHNVEILDLDKWKDLKLAYPIKKRKKATYILGHFNMEQSVIAALRRDLQLSEEILRHLILIDTGRMQFLMEDAPPETRRGEQAKPAAAPSDGKGGKPAGEAPAERGPAVEQAASSTPSDEEKPKEEQPLEEQPEAAAGSAEETAPPDEEPEKETAGE